jgi:hypothetical protein
LKYICKRYEEIRKQKKKKKRRNKNMKMDPGKCFSPAPQAAHGPATSLTESVHLSPLFPR